jgi:hypothetical protein
LGFDDSDGSGPNALFGAATFLTLLTTILDAGQAVL